MPVYFPADGTISRRGNCHAIIEVNNFTQRFSVFGHIARMPDETDAQFCRCVSWLSAVVPVYG